MIVIYTTHDISTSFTYSKFLFISQIDVEGPMDDYETTLGHINTMKAEIMKGTPDLAMMAGIMAKTFAFRWRKINDPKLSVDDILSDFPALRERNFVSLFAISILFQVSFW